MRNSNDDSIIHSVGNEISSGMTRSKQAASSKKKAKSSKRKSAAMNYVGNAHKAEGVARNKVSEKVWIIAFELIHFVYEEFLSSFCSFDLSKLFQLSRQLYTYSKIWILNIH